MADIKGLYQQCIDNGFLDGNKTSEEAFVDLLRDAKRRGSFYNFVKERDGEFFSADQALFNQNVDNALADMERPAPMKPQRHPVVGDEYQKEQAMQAPIVGPTPNEQKDILRQMGQVPTMSQDVTRVAPVVYDRRAEDPIGGDTRNAISADPRLGEWGEHNWEMVSRAEADKPIFDQRWNGTEEKPGDKAIFEGVIDEANKRAEAMAEKMYSRPAMSPGDAFTKQRMVNEQKNPAKILKEVESLLDEKYGQGAPSDKELMQQSDMEYNQYAAYKNYVGEQIAKYFVGINVPKDKMDYFVRKVIQGNLFGQLAAIASEPLSQRQYEQMGMGVYADNNETLGADLAAEGINLVATLPLLSGYGKVGEAVASGATRLASRGMAAYGAESATNIAARAIASTNATNFAFNAIRGAATFGTMSAVNSIVGQEYAEGEVKAGKVLESAGVGMLTGAALSGVNLLGQGVKRSIAGQIGEGWTATLGAGATSLLGETTVFTAQSVIEQALADPYFNIDDVNWAETIGQAAGMSLAFKTLGIGKMIPQRMKGESNQAYYARVAKEMPAQLHATDLRSHLSADEIQQLKDAGYEGNTILGIIRGMSDMYRPSETSTGVRSYEGAMPTEHPLQKLFSDPNIDTRVKEKICGIITGKQEMLSIPVYVSDKSFEDGKYVVRTYDNAGMVYETKKFNSEYSANRYIDRQHEATRNNLCASLEQVARTKGDAMRLSGAAMSASNRVMEAHEGLSREQINSAVKKPASMRTAEEKAIADEFFGKLDEEIKSRSRESVGKNAADRAFRQLLDKYKDIDARELMDIINGRKEWMSRRDQQIADEFKSLYDTNLKQLWSEYDPVANTTKRVADTYGISEDELNKIIGKKYSEMDDEEVDILETYMQVLREYVGENANIGSQRTLFSSPERGKGDDISDITHSDGNVYHVTDRDGKDWFVVDGNITVDGEGNVSLGQSDSRLLVRDTEGTSKYMPAASIYRAEVSGASDVRAEHDAEQAARANNEAEFKPGDEVRMVTPEGEVVADENPSRVVGVGEEGVEITTAAPDGSTETTVVPHREAADNLVAEPQKKYMHDNKDNSDFVVTMGDDGNWYVEGETEPISQEDLDYMIANKEWEETEAPAAPAAPVAPVAPAEVAAPSAPAAPAAPAEPAAPKYPTTADGKLDWGAMDAPTAVAAAREKFGDDDTAKQFFETRLAAAQKALDKVTKEKPKSTDEDAFLAEMKDINARKSMAQKAVESAQAAIDEISKPVETSESLFKKAMELVDADRDGEVPESEVYAILDKIPAEDLLRMEFDMNTRNSWIGEYVSGSLDRRYPAREHEYNSHVSYVYNPERIDLENKVFDEIMSRYIDPELVKKMRENERLDREEELELNDLRAKYLDYRENNYPGWNNALSQEGKKQRAKLQKDKEYKALVDAYEAKEREYEERAKKRDEEVYSQVVEAMSKLDDNTLKNIDLLHGSPNENWDSYVAEAMDKKAENVLPGQNNSVSLQAEQPKLSVDNEPKGRFIIESKGVAVEGRVRDLYDNVATLLGTDIRIPERLRSDVPSNTRAYYDRSTGEIIVNPAYANKPEMVLRSIVGHEVTHGIIDLSDAHPNLKRAFFDCVREFTGEDNFKKRFDRIRAGYDKAFAEANARGAKFRNLTDEEVVEEICADFAGDLVFTDDAFMKGVIDRVMSYDGSEDIIFGEDWTRWTKDFARILDDMYLAAYGEDAEFVKDLNKARELWASMFAYVAMKNREKMLPKEAPDQMNMAETDNNSLSFNMVTEPLLEKAILEYADSKDAKRLGWVKEDIQSIVKETRDMLEFAHKMISGDMTYNEFAKKNPTMKVDWRDGMEKPTVTWARNNIEYKFDMSSGTFCINNEAIEKMFALPVMADLMLHTADFAEYTSDDYLTLYSTLRDMGFFVSCKGCFDAAARIKMLPSVAQNFARDVNAVIVERNADPEAFDAAVQKMKGDKTESGLPAGAATKLDAIRIGVAGDKLTEPINWTQLMSAKGQTKMLSDWGGIFRAWQRTGAGRPKDKLVAEPYSGVIMKGTTTIIAPYGEKTPSFRDIEVNQGTGLRRNSHDEFRMETVIDEIQFMRDAWLQKLRVFKYSKELDDVRLFGRTGAKYNMSGFPAWIKGGTAAGLDENGKYAMAEESIGGREFPYKDERGITHYDGYKGMEEALKYCNKDVSLSTVVFSVPHLIKCMVDTPTPSNPSGIWGSFIPFHSSGATNKALFEQGLGLARANGIGHDFMKEALTDYHKGVTAFEQVQNDRFGEGWTVLLGKRAGTEVKPGHKLEFVTGTAYRNEALGVTYFASKNAYKTLGGTEQFDIKGEFYTLDSEDNKVAHPFVIDYNDKVRELSEQGDEYAYKTAADFYIEELRKIGLLPRFDFEVPEEIFIEMCSKAVYERGPKEGQPIDPHDPKLGWKGEGHGWSPCDSDAYYAMFCDYGMTDPETGKLAPHHIVLEGQTEPDALLKALPEDYIDVIKTGLERNTTRNAAEDAMVNDAVIEYCKRSIKNGKMDPKSATEILNKHGINGFSFSLDGEDAPARRDGESVLDYAKRLRDWTRSNSATEQVKSGFTVNDDYTGFNEDGSTFTDLIFSKDENNRKTVETRRRPTLDKALGTRQGIIKTGKNKDAEVVGYVTIPEDGKIVYTSYDEFAADQHRHRISPDDPQYGWDARNLNGKLYGYVLENPQRETVPYKPEAKFDIKENRTFRYTHPTDNGLKFSLDAANKDIYAAAAEMAKQDYGSGATSINGSKLPSGFGLVQKIGGFVEGGTNLDMGGGRFDNATEALAEQGVENLVFDPYNRSVEHNQSVAERVQKEGVDTSICNNCLNVINTPGARSNVILQCAKALKPGGTAYFTVYEGNGTGVGKVSKNDCWQENRKTADYLDEIREHFGKVEMKGKLIIASEPKTEGKVSIWNYDASGDDNLTFSLDDTKPVYREPGHENETTLEYAMRLREWIKNNPTDPKGPNGGLPVGGSVGSSFKNYHGTTIKRGGLGMGVGKNVGSQLYVHKDYAEGAVREAMQNGEQYLPEDFDYKTVMWDKNKPNLIRFDEAPDFDITAEPIPGRMITIDTNTGDIIRDAYSDQIWHHKWMWVGNDYNGFDVKRAYEWSKVFANAVHEIPSGSRAKWEDQLERAGLGESIDDGAPNSLQFSLARYGAPQAASKNEVAYDIINVLPDGERFVDLFGGGGAMTHAALLSGKYKGAAMNDIDPKMVNMFVDGIEGKYEGYDRQLTEEDYKNLDPNDPDRIIWSDRSLDKRYANDRVNGKIKRLNRLQELMPMRGQLETTIGDYRDVELKPGDVVYADIPYKGKSGGMFRSNGKTSSGFNVAEFYDWVREKAAEGVAVYISEYDAPADFVEVWSKEMRSNMGNKGTKTEKLFVHESFADDVNNSIRFSLDKDTEEYDSAAKNAVEKFGTTEDYKEAGWILKDGTMLDFSEKNNGGDPGVRTQDHRAISVVLDSEYGWNTLKAFENMGAVRVSWYGGTASIEMSKQPTKDQLQRIRGLVATAPDTMIEFMDEDYHNVAYGDFDNREAAKAVAQIDRFYEEGIKPQVKFSLDGKKGPQFREAGHESETPYEFAKRMKKYEQEEEANVTPLDYVRALRIESNEEVGKIDTTLRDADRADSVLESLMKDISNNKDAFEKTQKVRGMFQDRLKRAASAVAFQKGMDDITRRKVTDICKLLLKYGWVDASSRSQLNQLFGAISKTKDHATLAKQIQALRGLVASAAVKRAIDNLHDTLSIKDKKVNAAGVETIGKVDSPTQTMLAAFRGAINDVASDREDLMDQIAEISAKMDATKDKILKDDLNAQFVGLTLAQRFIDTIADGKKSERQLAADIQEATNTPPETDDASGRAAKQQHIDALFDSMVKVQAGMADAINEVNKDLMHGIAIGKMGAEKFIEKEVERVKFLNHIVNSDFSGKEINPSLPASSLARKYMDAMTSPSRSFESLLRMFGWKSPEGEGYMYDHFMHSWIQSRNNELTGRQYALKKMQDKAFEVFFTDNDGNPLKGKMGKDISSPEDALKDIEEILSKTPKVKLQYIFYGTPVTHELNQDQLGYIYLVNNETDGIVKLRKMGITQEKVDYVVEHLDPRFKEYLDWIQKDLLVELRNERYNPVHLRVFGANMGAIEDYFPLRVDHKQGREMDDLAEDGTTKLQVAGTTTGAIKKRVSNSLPLDLLNAGALKETVGHIMQMEQWAAFVEFNRDVNTIFSNNTFKNKIRSMNTFYGKGDELLKYVRDQFCLAAGTYRPKEDGVGTVLLNVVKGVTGAKINFRIFTSFKQITSHPAFWPYMTDGEFVKAYGDSLKPWKWADTLAWAKENMPIFFERVNARDLGDFRLMSRSTDWSNEKSIIRFLGKWQEFNSKWGMAANVSFDTLTCAQGAWGVYNAVLVKYRDRLGLSPEEAHEKALEAAVTAYNKSQQSNEAPYVSTIQRDRNWFAGSFTQFKNSPMAYTRNFIIANRNLVNQFGSMDYAMSRSEANEYYGIREYGSKEAYEEHVKQIAEQLFDERYPEAKANAARNVDKPEDKWVDLTDKQKEELMNDCLRKARSMSFEKMVDEMYEAPDTSGMKPVDAIEAVDQARAEARSKAMHIKRKKKDVMIEFMTKKYKRMGADDEQAKAEAERDYKKGIARNIASSVVYGYLLNAVWRLVGYAPYFILGDDKRKKKNLAINALSGGWYMSPLTGFVAGGIIEGIADGRNGVEEFFAPAMAVTQDVKKVGQRFKNDQYCEFFNDALNLIVQMGSGFNPAVATDAFASMYMAWTNDNIDISDKVQATFMALMSDPMSMQKEANYFDRILPILAKHPTGDIDAIKQDKDYQQLVKDYQDYNLVRSAPLTFWARSKEREEKYRATLKTQMNDALKERVNLYIESGDRDKKVAEIRAKNEAKRKKK